MRNIHQTTVNYACAVLFIILLISMVFNIKLDGFNQTQKKISSGIGENERGEDIFNKIDWEGTIGTKEFLSDRGKVYSFLYPIANEPEHMSNERLIHACLIMSIVDPQLKEDPFYQWMSKDIQQNAKDRLGISFSGDRVISDPHQDQGMMQYDEIKVGVDKNGRMIIGSRGVNSTEFIDMK